jgi:hypothetical protein
MICVRDPVNGVWPPVKKNPVKLEERDVSERVLRDSFSERRIQCTKHVPSTAYKTPGTVSGGSEDRGNIFFLSGLG